MPRQEAHPLTDEILSVTTTTATTTTTTSIVVPPPLPLLPHCPPPCLQSTRLISAEFTSNLSSILLKKMSIVLAELGITPDTLLPTLSVCDLYDMIRSSTIALLSLKLELYKKEVELMQQCSSMDKNGTLCVIVCV